MPGGLVAASPARRATARITCLSSSTGTGEDAELASCGLNSAGDAIGALRRKVGAGVEQAEIARVGHLHDAVLHALDGPAAAAPRAAAAASKSKLVKFRAKCGHVDRRRDGARLEAQQRLLQLAGQPLLDAPAVRRVREQRRDGVRQGMVIQRRPLPRALADGQL